MEDNYRRPYSRIKRERSRYEGLVPVLLSAVSSIVIKVPVRYL